MTTIESAPLAVHVGADDLPFVDIGGGTSEIQKNIIAGSLGLK